MRVIAGEARGFPLKGPPGPATRATSDKVRGAIFDALAPYIEGARVLDLYAGTGALGIEALSRGAASCLFVERAAAVCRVIEANLRTTKLAEGAVVWRLAVEKALGQLEAATGPPYDIILLDPPYNDPGIADVIRRVSRPGLVAMGGFAVLEHDKRWSPPADPGVLRLCRTRLYGDTGVTLWQCEEEAED